MTYVATRTLSDNSKRLAVKRAMLWASLVIGICSGCTHDGNSLESGEMTSEQFSAISIGMPEDKVSAVAGEPDLIQENANFGGGLRGRRVGTIWYYKDADASSDKNIYVYFQNGRVVSTERD